MTTNINKIVNLRLFDPKYRDRLISLAKGDEPIARQSLGDTYQEALLVLNEMGDEEREDAKTLITRQQRTLSWIIESSRDDGAAWLGAMSNIDLWHKCSTVEDLERLYKRTVINATKTASPRMRREVNQMIDAIFDLRERDLAADRRFRKIEKLAGGLFELSLFNEDANASTISEDMDEAETWLESCGFDETLKSFARRIIDMRNRHLWTVDELKSEITDILGTREKWEWDINMLTQNLLKLPLFQESTDARNLFERMDKAEAWIDDCGLGGRSLELARSIIDMWAKKVWTVAELQSDKAEERAICRNWVGDILAIVEDWKDRDTSLEDVLSDLEDLLDEEDDVRRGDLIKWIIRVVESTVDCDGLDIAAQVAKRPLYLERLEFDNDGRFIQAVLKERENDSDE